ncbi:MAG: hypothetical protein V3V34_11140 [Kiloniellales bacterium]
MAAVTESAPLTSEQYTASNPEERWTLRRALVFIMVTSVLLWGLLLGSLAALSS